MREESLYGKYFEKWKTRANESKMLVWENLQKRRQGEYKI